MDMQGFNNAPNAPQVKPGQGFGGKSQVEQRQATPEQQSVYNKTYAMAVRTLYDEKFMESAAKMITTAQSPVDGMAKVGSAIGIKIFSAAFEAGQPIEPIIMVEVGREFMEEVGEFAKLVGVEVSPEDVEGAYYMASDMIRTHMERSGMIDAEALAQEAEQARGMVDENEFMGEAQRIAALKQRALVNPAQGGQK